MPRKKDLLLVILKIRFEIKNINDNTTDMELSVLLKRRLSVQRYLIVMDDIWDVGAWNDLIMSFPDDNFGSKIRFTSRLADLPIRAQPESYQHRLPFLTDEESWDPLQYKELQKQSYPTWLVKIGMHIAKRCQGLPLSIAVEIGMHIAKRCQGLPLSIADCKWHDNKLVEPGCPRSELYRYW